MRIITRQYNVARATYKREAVLPLQPADHAVVLHLLLGLHPSYQQTACALT